MIIVKIILKKHGIGEEQLLSLIKITNDGTGGIGPIGNYNYEIFGKNNSRIMHKGHISGFKRKHKHALDLLKTILVNARK